MLAPCITTTLLKSYKLSRLFPTIMEEARMVQSLGVRSTQITLARTQYTSVISQSEQRDLSYESAIRSLNALQSNAATLQRIRKERQKHVHLNLPQTRLYLERSGVTQDMLNTLKVIHVSGTKGKGSTCAFCESILRQYGLRTGFYSSPHLVSATERVRLEGEPVSRAKFTQYFWDVYDKVCRGRSSEDRPPYFQFLTILAFNIFIREKVDVAIIEVGIGGEYDCTNIIQNPVVTGITALGLDHTNILGNTIAEIAWHKAGIMKAGTPTYIDGNQHSDALKVISARSRELSASSLAQVPDLDQFNWGRYPPVLGLHGQIQRRNAALALILSKAFLKATCPELLPGYDVQSPVASQQLLEGSGDIDTVLPFQISGNMALGLRLADWPGRTQMVEKGRLQYYLDGAHTEESVRACASWFNKASKQSISPNEKNFKVMIFNTSGDRDPQVLLTPFLSCHLDLVIFTTNLSGLQGAVDQENFTTTDKIQLDRCKSHLHLWTKLHTNKFEVVDENLRSTLPPITSGNKVPSVIIPLISDALLWLNNDSKSQEGQAGSNLIADIPAPVDLLDADRLQVLVTGSLHLVGGVIACIQEDGMPPRRKIDPELVARYKNPDIPAEHLLLPSEMPKCRLRTGRYNNVPGML